MPASNIPPELPDAPAGHRWCRAVRFQEDGTTDISYELIEERHLISDQDLSPKARLDRFHAKHGPDYVVERGMVYYPDGAHRHQEANGMLWEPSKDLYERQQCILHFWKLKLERLVVQFDEQKQLLLHKVTIDNDGKARLKELQAETRRCQKEHRIAEDRLLELMPRMVANPSFDLPDNSEFKDSIKSIEI